MSVIQLWNEERPNPAVKRQELESAQNTLRSMRASGIDGMWLEEVLLKLFCHPELPLHENDKRTLQGYGILDDSGNFKPIMRSVFLSNNY